MLLFAEESRRCSILKIILIGALLSNFGFRLRCLDCLWRLSFPFSFFLGGNRLSLWIPKIPKIPTLPNKRNADSRLGRELVSLLRLMASALNSDYSMPQDPDPAGLQGPVEVRHTACQWIAQTIAGQRLKPRLKLHRPYMLVWVRLFELAAVHCKMKECFLQWFSDLKSTF